MNLTFLVLTITIISSMLLFTPFVSYSERVDELSGVPEYQPMEPLTPSFSPTFYAINGLMQYQVRDASGGLVCIVESQNLDFYDHPITLNYFNSHSSHQLFEIQNGSLNMVVIKETWNVGSGDTFLSALRHAVQDYETEQLYYILFAVSNGCAIQPGDVVTTHWKILYIPN